MRPRVGKGAVDRSSQLAKANASLQESWNTLERTLAAASAGSTYLASRQGDVLAWRALMASWREGATGAKRTIALASEMERHLADLQAGYEAERAEAAVEAAANRAELERQAEAARRAADAVEHHHLMAGTAEIVHRQAADDARAQRSTEAVASLFAPGDLRDAGPG